MWSTLRTIPPTRLVFPSGMGGGSRMGSWPSVVNPEDVAELSRISVLGCGGPARFSSALVDGFTGIAGSWVGPGCCAPDGCGLGCCTPPGCAVAPGCGVVAEGALACVPESGVLGAPEAGCGSGELVCGHTIAAD